MRVAVSTSKVRICHDPSNAVSGRGVNEDIDTSAVPGCTIEHVLRDVIWRIAAAVEHAHNNTTFTNAVVTPEGPEAMSHVQVVPPRENEVRGRLPPDCVFPPRFGGMLRHKFWVRTYVYDALFDELYKFLEREAMYSSDTVVCVSNSFRLFGYRNTGEPPCLLGRKPRRGIRAWK